MDPSGSIESRSDSRPFQGGGAMGGRAVRRCNPPCKHALAQATVLFKPGLGAGAVPASLRGLQDKKRKRPAAHICPDAPYHIATFRRDSRAQGSPGIDLGGSLGVEVPKLHANDVLRLRIRGPEVSCPASTTLGRHTRVIVAGQSPPPQALGPHRPRPAVAGAGDYRARASRPPCHPARSW